MLSIGPISDIRETPSPTKIYQFSRYWYRCIRYYLFQPQIKKTEALTIERNAVSNSLPVSGISSNRPILKSDTHTHNHFRLEFQTGTLDLKLQHTTENRSAEEILKERESPCEVKNNPPRRL